MMFGYDANSNFKIMNDLFRMDRWWGTSFDIVSTKDVVK